MPRARDEALVEQARAFAAEGMTLTAIARRIGMDRKTLQRWGIAGVAGRPRVSDEQASARTRRRRRGDTA